MLQAGEVCDDGSAVCVLQHVAASQRQALQARQLAGALRQLLQVRVAHVQRGERGELADAAWQLRGLGAAQRQASEPAELADAAWPLEVDKVQALHRQVHEAAELADAAGQLREAAAAIEHQRGERCQRPKLCRERPQAPRVGQIKRLQAVQLADLCGQALQGVRVTG
jgi:hypothetical protein